MKEYTPLEIQAYRFTPDGKYYISKTVEIDGEEDRKLFIEHILNEVVNLCC